LTEDEITKNEKLWREENNKDVDIAPEGSDLRSIGVSVGDIESDQQAAEEMANPEAEMENPEVIAPVTTQTPGAAPAGGAPGGAGM
jgi:hypothetical protein